MDTDDFARRMERIRKAIEAVEIVESIKAAERHAKSPELSVAEMCDLVALGAVRVRHDDTSVFAAINRAYIARVVLNRSDCPPQVLYIAVITPNMPRDLVAAALAHPACTEDIRVAHALMSSTD